MLEEQTAELLQRRGRQDLAALERPDCNNMLAASARSSRLAVYDIMGAQATVCRCALHLHMLAV